MVLAGVWKLYRFSLNKYTLLTQATTGLVFGVLADLTTQMFIEKKAEIDFWKRSLLAVGSYGFIETAIEAKLLFEGLDRVFGAKNNMLNVSRKVFFDLFVYNLIEGSLFISWCNILEGHKESLKDKFSRDFGTTMMIGYCYWIPISIIQFRFVSLKYRSLFAVLTSFLDDVFLVYASHNNVKDKFKSLINMD